MTKEEFLNSMHNWKVDPYVYSIDGEEKEDYLNIKKESDNEYSVYYLERGVRDELKRVRSMEEAYDVIAQEIR